jgi:DNA-binding NtrC family response regulator
MFRGVPPPRVLVVDDEELVRTLVLRWLAKWGHDAVGAPDATEALKVMAEAPAEIAIVDLMMPVHDGLWLLNEIHQRWPATVSIVISGAQDEHLVLGARKLGAVAFVPKPLGRELLYQALERALSARASP